MKTFLKSMQMRLALAAVLALAGTLAFAAVEQKVGRRALAAVEGAVNDKFRTATQDPWDLLGTARGTYLDGYGALFTVELQLVFVSPPMPFHPAYSPAEIIAIHDRKVKKLPELREAMRSLIAGAAPTLETLPGNEKISMEAILWRYSWENAQGIPQRILMSGEKDKIQQARAAHTDLAQVIEEREQ